MVDTVETLRTRIAQLELAVEGAANVLPEDQGVALLALAHEVGELVRGLDVPSPRHRCVCGEWIDEHAAHLEVDPEGLDCVHDDEKCAEIARREAEAEEAGRGVED